MESRKKEIYLRQKARFEKTLQNRLNLLSEKGVVSPRADRDPLVRKWKAEAKAVENRLKRLAELDKQNEEKEKNKADRAAAPAPAAPPEKEKQAKGGKDKKPKPERKKAPEGGQG
jgi:hypothetical protein